MAESSISKLVGPRANSEYAVSLGRAIRERRRARGLTQTELGRPLTKGFVSEVERGRSLPSLRALTLLAHRLGVPVSELLADVGEIEGVKNPLSDVYTAPDENEHAPASAGHR